jgi:hypothetical protein
MNKSRLRLLIFSFCLSAKRDLVSGIMKANLAVKCLGDSPLTVCMSRPRLEAIWRRLKSYGEAG